MPWSLAAIEKNLLIGSTLVEGSTLSESEAEHVLAGRTISGHPVHEVRELLNYRAAVAWMIEQTTQAPFVSVDLLLGFHRHLFVGFSIPSGAFKTHQNFTVRSDGTKHKYLSPTQTPEAVRQWVSQFNAAPQRDSAAGAAQLYGEFQSIHPFDDGNGRVGRVWIAYWLHWKFGMGFQFFERDKVDHLRAIEATNSGDYVPLTAFIQQRLVTPP